MKRSVTFAWALRWSTALILLWVSVTLPVEARFRGLVETGGGSALGEYEPAYPLTTPTLQWHTFMGGSSNDWGKGIALDGSGNAYVVGFSYTTWGSPVNAYAGEKDAFVAKLDASGALQWNTFLGSADEDDDGNGIAVDGSGNLYIVGTSDATWGSPLNPFAGGFSDAFVARLDSGGALSWLTFLGGTAADAGNGIALDNDGNVYVVGQSGGTWGSPIDPYPGGWYAPFVAKLSSSGALQWSTFWGAGGLDEGRGIAIDGSGNVYVVGVCYATWGSPVNPYTGGTEACAAKLDTDGARQWNTFLGSAGSDSGFDIAVDGSGNVFVVGESSASWGTPVCPHGGVSSNDAFAARLNGSDGVRRWNTFMGFTNTSSGLGVAVDKIGYAYVVGESKEGSVFSDAYLAQLDADGLREWNVFLGHTYNHDYGYGVVPDGSGHATVVGFSNASWGSPVNGHSGMQDAFAAKLLLPAQVDVAITKTAEPNTARPGGTTTYALDFSNRGYLTATGVLITDSVPITLTNLSYTRSGAAITPTGSVSYTWEVEDLGPGMGGVITITGIISPGTSPGMVLINTATITGTTADSNPDNNSSSAWVLIPSSRVFLPLAIRDS